MRGPDLTPLVGCQITQITLDYQVTLHLASPSGGPEREVSAWLTIAAPFLLTVAGEGVAVDPDTFGNYDRVPRLLGTRVVAAAVKAELSLSLRFSDDTRLTSARTPEFESWQLGGQGVRPWIALPSGP